MQTRQRTIENHLYLLILIDNLKTRLGLSDRQSDLSGYDDLKELTANDIKMFVEFKKRRNSIAHGAQNYEIARAINQCNGKKRKKFGIVYKFVFGQSHESILQSSVNNTNN